MQTDNSQQTRFRNRIGWVSDTQIGSDWGTWDRGQLASARCRPPVGRWAAGLVLVLLGVAAVAPGFAMMAATNGGGLPPDAGELNDLRSDIHQLSAMTPGEYLDSCARRVRPCHVHLNWHRPGEYWRGAPRMPNVLPRESNGSVSVQDPDAAAREAMQRLALMEQLYEEYGSRHFLRRYWPAVLSGFVALLFSLGGLLVVLSGRSRHRLELRFHDGRQVNFGSGTREEVAGIFSAL